MILCATFSIKPALVRLLHKPQNDCIERDYHDHGLPTKSLVKEDNMYNAYLFCDELYYETLNITEPPVGTYY